MVVKEEDYLMHYGIQRKSGRYPWGSGANPKQRSKTFLDMVNELEKSGMSKPEIAKSFSTPEYPFSTKDLKELRTIATNIQKQDQIRQVQRLKDKSMGDSAIGRQMGLNESTVRSLLAPGRQQKLQELQNTADMLKRQVAEKEFVDIGAHTELNLPIGDNPDVRIGISKDKFNSAIAMLKDEGYEVHPVYQRQLGTGEFTRYKVLCKPGTTKTEAYVNRAKIRPITEHTDNRGGDWTDLGIKPPLQISSKRVAVKYKEDGGADADGVIYVRPGVKDVELGKSRYAQVRIGVDGTHFLKGMAVYKDDLPDGIDLQFNTNKSNTGKKLDAMKPIKKDTDNPFGSVLKLNGQILDEHGNVTSVMNKLNEEGDWDKWSKTLSRQVLSKQKPELAKSQLNMTAEKREEDFAEIKRLTNPLIRQTLLRSFSDETDSAAVHLKAASMPSQANKVILPSNHIKPNEIFAPTYDNGTRVALIRFPHAGRFEIPELTVNNRNKEVQKMFGGKEAGTVPDAVVIHPRVAERLSGADFDGDHVVVIPNDRGSIQTQPALEKLKGFDPQEYKVPLGPKTKKHPDGTPIIKPATKQHEMGNVTNLISDMTIKGANSDELARAVRHSMVVIDSEKHNLDYKASARDHGILDLKRKYQGVTDKGGIKGAATLITRATSEKHVDQRKLRGAPEGPIDRRTGEKVFVPTGATSVKYKDANGRTQVKSFRSRDLAEQFVKDQAPDGEIKTKKFESKQLAEVKDAKKLLSDHGGQPIERVYADHSNRLKALANEARLEMINTQLTPYSKTANVAYRPEVESLKSQLRVAQMNAPLERRAQTWAGMVVAQKKRENPDMDRDEEKKFKGQALNEARDRMGAKKTRVDISPREWDAIQAGAISNTMLKHILNNTDIDKLKKLATPKQQVAMTSIKSARARTMLASGATLKEVADALGVGLSTLKKDIAENGR